MPRLALAGLLALSACTAALDIPPNVAFAQARAAIEAGETGTAHRLLTHAAEGGNLDAMTTLAWSYRAGYYTQGYLNPSQPGSGHTQLPTWRDEAQSVAWTQRYLDSVRTPSPDVRRTRLRALDLLDGQPSAHDSRPSFASIPRGAPDASPAQRREAETLLTALVEAGDADAAFLLAQASTSPAERDDHLDQAVTLGSAPACFWRAFGQRGPSAQATAAFLDAFEACETMDGWTPPPEAQDPRVDTDRTLREQIARGNAEAQAMRDSLVILGALPDA